LHASVFEEFLYASGDAQALLCSDDIAAFLLVIETRADEFTASRHRQ
jgi:hypothetical protein